MKRMIIGAITAVGFIWLLTGLIFLGNFMQEKIGPIFAAAIVASIVAVVVGAVVARVTE